MRIGVLHQYGLQSSGSGLYAVHVVQALLRRGHQVCLISRDPDPGRPDWVTDVLGDTELPALPAAPGTCRAYRLTGGVSAVSYPRAEAPGTPTFAELSDADVRTWVTYHADAVTEIARREQLDVLHANHEVPMAFVASEVKRRIGVPYVVVAHGSTLEYVYAQDERYAGLTRDGLRNADRIVALTAELRERLLNIVPDAERRISVVAAGVDLEVFTPAPVPGSGPPTVTYVGRMGLEKGVHVLLAAFPEVVRHVPGARLRLVGEGVVGEALREVVRLMGLGDLAGAETALREIAAPSEAAWLEPVLDFWHGPQRAQAAAEARAARLSERVRFTGALDPQGVAAELRSASVVAVPSLVREAFPLVTLEALASGVPPVAADHGGLAAVLDEIAPELGALGPELRISMDPSFVVQHVAGALTRVLRRLNSPAEARRWSERCRELAVEGYGWGRVARDLEEAYTVGAVPEDAVVVL